MIKEEFKTYNQEEFVLDEDFRAMVRSSDSLNDLDEMMKAMPEKKHEISMAVKILGGLHQKQITQPTQRKQELWNEIMESQRITHPIFSLVKIAATFLILIGIGSLIFYHETSKPRVEKIAESIPVGNDAILILPDGKTVNIGRKESTIKVSSDGSGIMVNDTTGIAHPQIKQGLNQLIVPFGKRSSVTLADGTQVWINSGSRLSFPQVFDAEKREVVLEGEALFSVAKDQTKPFYVKTDAFQIKVYGTKFNVNVFKGEEEYNVVLVNGKVSMNSPGNSEEVYLHPNQKASIKKGGQDFKIENIKNTDLYTAWAEGYLIFSNERVNEVLKRVSRYYNVPIECNLPENTNKICGKLDLKDDLDRVLKGIAFISRTKYTKEGDKYVFN